MPASITASPEAVANRPSFSRNGVRSPAFGSTPDPKYGPPPTTSPSLPMIRASSEMLPTALSTPGTPRTSSSVDAGMVGRAPSWSSFFRSNAVLAETTPAVPSYAASDSESEAPRIVSVSV